MKKIAFLLIFAGFFSGSLLAQESEKDTPEKKNKPENLETLLNGKIHISGFGAPLNSWGSINGKFAAFNGGGGAVLLNRQFFIGGYGLELENKVKTSELRGTGSQLQMEHGGLWIGYDCNSNRLIHPTVSLKTGWGTASLTDGNGRNEYARASIFAIEPEMGMEINIAKFFKIALTGSYRIIQSNDRLDGFNLKHLNGFALNTSLKFGWFK